MGKIVFRRAIAGCPVRIGQLRMLLASTILAVLPALLGGQEARAQSQMPEEIVVTAQKRAESIREVPQSLAVLQGDLLAKRGVQQLEDLTAQIPGVTTYNFGGAGQTQINIRGVTVGLDTAATVATYIDDIPFGSGSAYSGLAQIGLELGTFDVQRVELLRGPQGTLYGASALGGLLKYVLAPAQMSELSATLQLEGSTSSRSQGYAVRAAVNAPIVAGKVALRVTALDAHDGGQVDNLARKDSNADRNDKQVGRLTIAFEPTDVLKLRASVLAQRLDRNGSSDVYYDRRTQKPVYGDLTIFQPTASPLLQESQLYALNGEYDLGFATVQATVGRQHFMNDYVNDASEAYPAALAGLVAMDATSIESHLSLRKTTAELRLASNGKQRFEWIAGLYHTDEDILKMQRLAGYSRGVRLPTNIGTFYVPATYRERAAYANATYHFTERLDATFGLRASRNDQTFRQEGSGLIVPSNPGSAAHDTVFTYLGTVRYHFAGENMIYARASSGYRPGGPNLVISDPATGRPIGATQFTPDSIWNYEVGAKLRPLPWLTADLSAFYIDWTDMQVPAVVNGIGVFANGGTAKSEGLEFALTAYPTDRWTATLAGAWILSELTVDAPNVQGRNGERLPNSPHWSVSASTDYQVWQANDLTASLGATWKYLGTRTASFDASAGLPQYVLPSFHAVDLRASLEGTGWNADLYARNIFDERGQLSANMFLAFAGGPARVTVNRARTVGVVLTTRF